MKFKCLVFAIAALAISCGPGKPTDYQLKSVGLTVTVPGKSTVVESARSEYMPALSQFFVDGKGVEVIETDAESFPTDLKMLETAMAGAEDVDAITERKTVQNGAFGVVYYRPDGDKEFLFYFKKGDKHFKITPVGIEDDYTDVVAAIGTLK